MRKKVLLTTGSMAVCVLLAGLLGLCSLLRVAEKFEQIAELDMSDASAMIAWSQEVGNRLRFGKYFIASISGLSLVLAMLIGFLFARYLNRRLIAIAERLGDGVRGVAEVTETIVGSSTRLSSSAVQQSSAIQEAASTIAEISAMAERSAGNAKKSHTATTAGEQNAEKGQQTVQELLQAIAEISESNGRIAGEVSSSFNDISGIIQLVSEIGDKTKVINDIVFQTKLLSFNASVEAARAGAAGQGFAIVAEEVGKLAEISGKSAQEISQLLDSSVARVEAILEGSRSRLEPLIEASKTKVNAGLSASQRCEAVLREIIQNVHEVNRMVGQIMAATEEQVRGTGEISRVMQQLEGVTETNTGTSKELRVMADDLRGQMRSMRSSVDALTAMMKGLSDESAPGHELAQVPHF